MAQKQEKRDLFLVVQTNLLNKISRPSTLICPITTNVQLDSEILRVHLQKGDGGIYENCDIMLDQIRSIDNKRLLKKVGNLPKNLFEKLKENIEVIFDLD